jgi:hypothetical protein
MLPRKKLKTASSLVQASPKRNTPVATAKAGLSAIASQYFRGLESDLFDCHREPADQPCDFVQLLLIANLDGSRKPNEAFVIAQRGYVAGNDRRHRPDAIGLDIWHRITSGEPRQYRALPENASF